MPAPCAFPASAYFLAVKYEIAQGTGYARPFSLGRPEADDSAEQSSAWHVAILPLMFPPRILLSDRIPPFSRAAWRM